MELKTAIYESKELIKKLRGSWVINLFIVESKDKEKLKEWSEYIKREQKNSDPLHPSVKFYNTFFNFKKPCVKQIHFIL